MAAFQIPGVIFGQWHFASATTAMNGNLALMTVPGLAFVKSMTTGICSPKLI